MGLVLGLLAIPSMFVGYFGRDLFIGLGSNFWGNSLFCLPFNLGIIDAEFIYLYKNYAIIIKYARRAPFFYLIS